MPLWAMVPRFWTSSSRVIPMPESAMVMVRSASSVEMVISSGRSASVTESPVSLWWRSFSSASEALETNSRRKISRSV